MSRITSREAIKQLRNEGRISELQQQVLEILRLYNGHGITAREMVVHGGPTGAWKRLSELARKGWVVEDGIKTCSVTGKRAIAWKLGDGTVPMKKEEPWTYNPLMVTIYRQGTKAMEFNLMFSQGFNLHEIGREVTKMLNRRFP